MQLPPLEWLQTLSIVAAEGSLSAAAKRRNMSQPAVSWQMKELQAHCGHPLFERRGRNLILNAFGHRILASTGAPLASLQKEFAQLLEEAQDPGKMYLRIGARQEILRRLFANLSFVGTLDLQEMSSAEVTRALMQESLDFGVSRERPPVDGYVVKKLFRSQVALIIPDIFLPSPIPFADLVGKLAEFPAAAYSLEQPLIKDFLKRWRLEQSRIDFFVADWDLIEERVHAGKAWAVVPQSHCLTERNYHRYEIPHSQNEQQDFYIFYRKGYAKKAWLRKFLDDININIAAAYA